MMKKYFLILFSFWAVAAQALTLPYLVKIPEDTSQQHFIVYHQPQAPTESTHQIIVEVRGRFNSQFYAINIDCQNMKSQYFGSAPTWKQLMTSPARYHDWYFWNPITRYYGYVICDIF